MIASTHSLSLALLEVKTDFRLSGRIPLRRGVSGILSLADWNLYRKRALLNVWLPPA